MKKRFLLLLLNLIFAFTSCNFEIEDIKRDVKLVDFSMDLAEARTTYNLGDNFDKSHIKLYCHYSDGTLDEGNLDLLSVLNFNSNEVGEQQVRLFYEGFEKFLTVKIEPRVPVKFKMLNPPTNLVYTLEETDAKIEGLRMAVVYNNNSEEAIENLENDCEITYRQDYSRIEIASKCYDIPVYEFGIVKELRNVKQLKIEGNLPWYRPGDRIEIEKLTVLAQDDKNNTVQTNSNVPYYYDYEQIPLNYTRGKLQIKCSASESVVGYFTVNVINACSVDSTLTIDSEFFNQNYNGEVINLSDTKLFTFKESFDNGTQKSIDKANLRYSTENLNSSEGNFPEKAKSLETPFSLKAENGKQTIWFYHKYMDYYACTEKIRKWSQDLIVERAKIKELQAVFQLNNGVSSVPLEETPDPVFESNYGKWNINAIWTDDKQSSVELSDCVFSFVNNQNQTENNTNKIIQIKLKRLQNEEEIKTTYNMSYGEKVLISVEFPNNGVVSLQKENSEVTNFKLTEGNLSLNYSDGSKDTSKNEFFINTPIDENKIGKWNNYIIKERKDASSSYEVNLYVIVLNDIVEEQSESNQEESPAESNIQITG